MLSQRCRLIALMLIGVALTTVPAEAADPLPEIQLTLENSRFNPEELKVKAGAPVMLVITNKDSVDEEFEIPNLRIEKMIPAGRTRRLKLPPLKPGTYGFVGEYQQNTAKGRIVAE